MVATEAIWPSKPKNISSLALYRKKVGLTLDPGTGVRPFHPLPQDDSQTLAV